MKNRILLITAVFLCLSLPVQASANEYTLSVKGSSVLQNEPDREIAVQSYTADRQAPEGESPVTGLPWSGRYLPMLAEIGNDEGKTKVNGYNVETAGVGNRTPWGIQYADMIYEDLVYKTGYTRFTVLLSDCFAAGEPAVGIGPMRSVRIISLLIREEWQCGLVMLRRFNGAMWDWLLKETRMLETGAVLEAETEALRDAGYRVKGVKSPNYNADIRYMREMVPETFVSPQRAFLFKDGEAYTAYEAAQSISLDWGYKNSISHFVYNEAEGVYYRYCGAGVKPEKWAPFTAYPTAEERDEKGRIPIAFANVIIQRMAYTWENDSKLRPIPQSIGRGNADIFIDGRYIPGYWVCPSLGEPTRFYDDRGNEIQFSRGKTFIAHFPPEAVCTYRPVP